MKPIYLRFSGLHSYTDEQRIDFTALLGAGVFGIFGPTGSGKSTILDAITLALYGMVERAANRTQGIINQYSRQALVSFTFELTDAEGTHRYRVERTFRNGKTFSSVEAAQARLLELCQGTTGWEDNGVLADKASTVTERVVEILGLSQTDFTRAVVLPQGKFAEFLTLGGRDRRSMLQRLFGLELYGDHLSQQVKAELQASDTSLQAVQAARTVLGDASPSALQTAAQTVKTAETAKEKAVQAATLLEAEVATWAQIWQWQAELKQVHQQLAKLAEKAEVQQAMEVELAGAERAERVRSMLTAVTTAEEAAKAAELAWQEACQTATTTQEALSQARLRRLAKEQAWAEESPHAYKRQADLKRAVDLEDVARKVQQELTEAAKAVETIATRLAELEQASTEATSAGAQAQTALARLRQEIQQRSITPAERSRVTNALSALNRVADAEKHLAKERRQESAEETAWRQATTQAKLSAESVDQAKKVLDATQSRYSKHLVEQPHTAEELATHRREWQEYARLADQVETQLTLLAVTQKEATELVTQTAKAELFLVQVQAARDKAQADLVATRNKLTIAEQALVNAQHADMAATLATKLTSEKPCPVCGSDHHPAPAITQDPALLAELGTKIQVARQESVEAEDALNRANEIWTKATSDQQNLVHSLARAREEQERLTSQRQKLATGLPSAWQECSAEELRLAVQQADSRLHQHEIALQNWQETRQTLEEELRQATAVSAAADKQYAIKISAEDAAHKAYTQASLRAGEATLQLQAVQAELGQLLADQTPQEITALGEQYSRWDRDMVDLRLEEDRWLVREKDAAAQLQASRQAETQARDQRIQAEERQKSFSSKLDDLEQEIMVITGPGVSAAIELTAVTKRLEQLTQEQNAAKANEAAADNAYQLAAQSRSRAEERRTLAGQSLQSAHMQLVEALVASGFSNAVQAQAALRPVELQEQMREQTGTYQQEVSRWQQEQKRLEESLDGRTLSTDEWQHWQERLVEVRKQRDTAIENAAVASSCYKDLELRHTRWTELAKEETTLSDRVGRLQDLSSLLRGNAFVDFLAEQQLQQVAWEASAHLGQLTRYRYALEVTSDGSFIIRDDASGGYKRAVHTLSGGETFLTSLALALALSAQIQLRGRYPLQFFFLDEGFGSLDQELLDVAMTALERLNLAQLHVGVISHVPELRNRIQHRLVVEPAVPGVQGSRVMPDFA